MSPVGSITMDVRRTSVSTNPYLEQNGGFALGGSLATLSMAAEQAAMQDDFATTPAMPTFGMPPAVPHLQNPQVQSDPVHPSQPDTMTMPFAPQDPGLDFGVDFGDSLDNLAMMWDSGPHSSYPFASLLTTEQPVPFFSPDFSNYGTEFVGGTGSGTQRFTTHNDEPSSFSRFGSRLPSLQPEEKAVEHQPPAPRHFSEVSPEDRQYVAAQLMHFQATLPQDFQLPTRLALSRYLAAYINGFHEHLPFLHIPTMSIERCSIELVLAMAAIGAQYCFEGEKGVELFNASQAIAIHRIRRRDARLAAFHRRAEAEVPASTPGADCASGMGGRFPSIESFRHSNSGPLGLPTEPDPSDGSEVVREDLMQTAQALLLLMAMATWAKHKEILREALAIQSVLATLVRDDGLKSEPIQDSVAWEEWVRAETIKRTKFIVFCFFNLHCIVYNIPPLILNSELNLQLPCSAVEFKAGNAAQWREARKRPFAEQGFTRP
ncbi:hypothetical protein H2203_005337 [Taxawa tesnikishii (nom. ined.)]|nr:hypothetical protein H2203_005337 [Dothideales sp. JES 119]